MESSKNNSATENLHSKISELKQLVSGIENIDVNCLKELRELFDMAKTRYDQKITEEENHFFVCVPH